MRGAFFISLGLILLLSQKNLLAFLAGEEAVRGPNSSQQGNHQESSVLVISLDEVLKEGEQVQNQWFFRGRLLRVEHNSGSFELISLTNRTLGYQGTLFKGKKLTSDYIPLVEGINQIVLELKTRASQPRQMLLWIQAM